MPLFCAPFESSVNPIPTGYACHIIACPVLKITNEVYTLSGASENFITIYTIKYVVHTYVLKYSRVPNKRTGRLLEMDSIINFQQKVPPTYTFIPTYILIHFCTI